MKIYLTAVPSGSTEPDARHIRPVLALTVVPVLDVKVTSGFVGEACVAATAMLCVDSPTRLAVKLVAPAMRKRISPDLLMSNIFSAESVAALLSESADSTNVANPVTSSLVPSL